MGGESSAPVKNPESMSTLYTPHSEVSVHSVREYQYYYDYCKENPWLYPDMDESELHYACDKWAEKRLKDSKSCTKQIFQAIIDGIKNKINPNKYPPPKTPGALCLVMGSFGAIIVIMVSALVLYYGKDIVGYLFMPFKMLLNGMGRGAAYTSNFIGDMAQNITATEGTVMSFARMVIDTFFRFVESIVEYTDVNRYLIYLNVATLFLAMFYTVYNETIELEDLYKGSTVQHVYNFLDWPFRFILDYVQYFDGGKGLLYKLVKFILSPFEGGVLLMSFVVSGVLYMIELFLQVLTEDFQN